jgi:cell division protein FtsL
MPPTIGSLSRYMKREKLRVSNLCTLILVWALSTSLLTTDKFNKNWTRIGLNKTTQLNSSHLKKLAYKTGKLEFIGYQSNC